MVDKGQFLHIEVFQLIKLRKNERMIIFQPLKING